MLFGFHFEVQYFVYTISASRNSLNLFFLWVKIKIFFLYTYKKKIPCRFPVCHTLIWATTRENLSSWFPTRSYQNHPTQLQRLACSRFRYDTFLYANKKGTDQTAQVCAFVVRKHQRQVFSSRPTLFLKECF